MLEVERQRMILKRVNERSVVSVSDLMDLLDVSEATIRRDIQSLAEAGQLRRVRGGVEALHPRHSTYLAGVPFNLAESVNIPQKRAIAKAAAALVEPGEAIIINGGTTTMRLAEHIRDMEIDILTNSFPIASLLFPKGRARITLPGGTLYPEQNIILSPFEDDAAQHFWASKLFTGAFGISRVGLMEADPLIVHATRKLLRQAERIVVLADSSKLRRQSAIIVAPLDKVSTLITDTGATEAMLEPFRDAGVEVILAESDPKADKDLSEVA